MAIAVHKRRNITVAGAIVLVLLGAPSVAIAASNAVIDLDGLSSDIYDHPSSSARARAAIFDAVPIGLSVSAARARLEQSGMRCAAGVILRCYASIYENVDYRDYSSIMWHVAIRSEHGRVSDVRAEVN